MYLLIPKISIILKGKPDRNNKKLLYMRYAIGGKTSWLSLKVSVDESSWDSKKRMVKGRSTDAPNINQYINSIKFEADQICFEWASKNRGKLLSFEMFKGFFLKENSVKSASPGISAMLNVLQDMYSEQEISTSSYRAYVITVNSFIKANLVQTISEITISIVSAYRKHISSKNNPNLAAQYVRNLRVVFRHTIRRLGIQATDPFTEKVTITRLSSKKNLTFVEYKMIVTHFQKIDGFDKDILRRFLVLCKGLRYSDTVHLKKPDLQEFRQGEDVLYYFNRPAQKTGIAGIIHFYNEENDLLQFGDDSKLFRQMKISDYNFHLKRISKEIIGREITSHYGRHFAGDQAINSGFDIDDVKAILGISNENTARIYAQRQNTTILTKLLTYAKNKKNTPDG
jgi:integrase